MYSLLGFGILQVVQQSLQCNFRIMSHPPQNPPYTHTHTHTHTHSFILDIPLPSPAPGNPLIYFLSLWICLFWTLQINGIIQHVAFCDSLLSLSLMFSRFIHVVARISPLAFFKILFYLFIWPWGQHVGSLTRDRTRTPCIRRAVLTTGPRGKSLHWLFKLPNDIPLYVCIASYLSIYQLMDVWVVPTF